MWHLSAPILLIIKKFCSVINYKMKNLEITKTSRLHFFLFAFWIISYVETTKGKHIQIGQALFYSWRVLLLHDPFWKLCWLSHRKDQKGEYHDVFLISQVTLLMIFMALGTCDKHKRWTLGRQSRSRSIWLRFAFYLHSERDENHGLNDIKTRGQRSGHGQPGRFLCQSRSSMYKPIEVVVLLLQSMGKKMVV